MLFAGIAMLMAGSSGALLVLMAVMLADHDNPWSGAFAFVLAPLLFTAIGVWICTHVVAVRRGSRIVTPLTIGAFTLVASLTLVDEYVELTWQRGPSPTEAEASYGIVLAYGAEVSLRVGTEHARGPAPDSDPWALTGDAISGVERLVAQWDRSVAIAVFDTSGDGSVNRVEVSDGTTTMCWPATVAPGDPTFPLLELDAVVMGSCAGDAALEHPGVQSSRS